MKRLLLFVAPLALVGACGGSGDGPCTVPPDVSGLDFATARKQLGTLEKLCVLDPPTTRGSGVLVPKNGAVPYDLTTPLFSDYAGKYRTLWIPTGTKIHYTDEVFDFPVGTIITKTFSFAADLRQPTQNIKLVETRVLMRTTSGWLMLPYVWNADETEAKLDILGSLYTTPFIDSDGTTQTPAYLIPSANQCSLCHEGVDPAQPIGLKARLLNRASPYLPGAPNQLDHLTTLGWLDGAPASTAAPRIPPYDDPTAGSVNDRARGWLETNCAHCHNPKGGARTTNLFLMLSQNDPFVYGVCKPPVAASSGTGGREYDVIPGQPDASIITSRLESTNPTTMMPAIGRSLVHKASLPLIREWITGLPGDCN